MKAATLLAITFALAFAAGMSAAETFTASTQNGRTSLFTNQPGSTLSISTVAARTISKNNALAVSHPRPWAALQATDQFPQSLELPDSMRSDTLTNLSLTAHDLTTTVCCRASWMQPEEFAWRAQALPKATKPASPRRAVRFFAGGAVISAGRSDEREEGQGDARSIIRWYLLPSGQSWGGPDYAVEPQGLRFFNWRW